MAESESLPIALRVLGLEQRLMTIERQMEKLIEQQHAMATSVQTLTHWHQRQVMTKQARPHPTADLDPIDCFEKGGG